MAQQEKAVQQPETLYCNVCGKKLKVENGILKEDVFEAVKEWGYFSKKDLQIHRFNICEHCYDEMICKFAIPVKISNKKEAI